MEPHAIGADKLSVQITRKTTGDLVVSNHAIERFFVSEEDAVAMLQEIVAAIGAITNGKPHELIPLAKVKP